MKFIPLGVFQQAAVRIARLDGLSVAGFQEEIQRGEEFAAELAGRVTVEAGYPLAGRNRPITMAHAHDQANP